MNRLWSILFLAVPILGVLVFVWALNGLWPLEGAWLPENINKYGGVIDTLFMFILYLTGAIFVGTGVFLFWFLWKYDSAQNTEPVKFVHGSHSLEVFWSILPAAALLFIAIYQMNAWADAKMNRPMTVNAAGESTPVAPLAEVTGRQFQWLVRYAGANGVIGDADDLILENELHVPANEDVVLAIKSEDVLHSFFLPHMRIKQDVVPGMKQYTWFHPVTTGVYDIVCAELCGWGHYKMKGQITVQSREEFDAWLAERFATEQADVFVPQVEEE